MEMEYLKKVINDELKTMNESDRETFRKTALITYKEMLDEFKDRIEYFESRIINSMSNDERNKNIYTLITEKENYYLYEDNFYPLYAEDLKEIELSGTIDKKQTIKRIFIKKSYQDLLDLQGLVLDGNIIVNGNYYEVKYKIEIDDKYLKQIKLLYDIFMINGQEWRTVNTANAMKIFKVTLDKYDVELENEKLDSKNTIINIEYDHLEEYIIENPLLLWNIQEKEIIGTMLVRPTENNIRYEHILKCNDAKGIYIYPIGQKIFLSYPTDQNNFHVITDKKEINIWKIWDIKAINNDQLALEKDALDEYNLYTNIEKFTKQISKELKGSDFAICANVDLYSGFVYQLLGIPNSIFTPLFALSRIASWNAHRIEQLTSERKIIRPAYKAVDKDGKLIL